MVSNTTIEHLRWHAGLQQRDVEDVPSIASSTWPRGRESHALQQAVADCLKTLATLNRELNHEIPTPEADLPRSLVYAMTEIVRMMRECNEQARDREEATSFARAAWRVETAWSAVLAGDIDDILRHVEEEEAARFG